MARLQVLIAGGPSPGTPAHKVTLIGDDGKPVTLPITNPQTDLGNLAPNWVEVPRPGLQETAYLSRGPRPLHTVQLDVTLVDITGQAPDIEGVLADLFRVCNSSQIVLGYGGFESSKEMTASGKYVCTAFNPKITLRSPDTNNAVQGSASITLKESNPVPNLVIGSPLNTATGLGLAASIFKALYGNTPSTYTVKAGDSLMTVSQAVYGTTSQWRTIGDANGISDARNLKPGTVLFIPPPNQPPPT